MTVYANERASVLNEPWYLEVIYSPLFGTTGRLFERLRNKPFWLWNIEEHKAEAVRTREDCCFNHIIGLPTKEAIEKPIFDYERTLYDALLIPENRNPLKHDFKHKHLWLRKPQVLVLLNSCLGSWFGYP
jgi:hypothetical protein